MKKEFDSEQPYGGVIINGFVMLGVTLLLLLVVVWSAMSVEENIALGIVAAAALVAAVFCLAGLFVQQPNQCSVMTFFGKYSGSFAGTGFYWRNPFCLRSSVSLRIRNMDIDPIKVNDKVGNPVLIGMVLVWKVADTYKAVFDVDHAGAGMGSASLEGALNNFVRIQSDAALREVTGHYAYDDDSDRGSDSELTLRSGGEEINERLENKINERMAMAGIKVVEARINYLAYAPEIAAVMLRRQQASAIITAREKIVEGAVSMVKMALAKLEEDKVVEMSDDRKAAMVSNLMVVLCADDAAQPVVNAGN